MDNLENETGNAVGICTNNLLFDVEQENNATICRTITDEKVQRSVALFPWRHNVLIISKSKVQNRKLLR